MAVPVSSRGSSLRRMLLPTSVSGFGLAMVVAMLCARLSRRRGLHRVDDVLVSGAAAEVPLQAVADLVVGGIGMIGQELSGGHDHARRAESALQPVLIPEGLLDGVELAGGGHAFDGQQFAAVGLHGEHGARFDGPAVEHDGTGAADRRFAADVRSREAGVFPQIVDQKEPRLDFIRIVFAINSERDLPFHERIPREMVRRYQKRSGKQRGEMRNVREFTAWGPAGSLRAWRTGGSRSRLRRGTARGTQRPDLLNHGFTAIQIRSAG